MPAPPKHSSIFCLKERIKKDLTQPIPIDKLKFQEKNIMPFINTITTKKITDSDRDIIKAELGKIIAEIPGKSEQWLMLAFKDEVKMYFRGDDSLDSAYVEVSIFGSAPSKAYDRVTAKICELYESKLGIPSDRVYVKYEESNRWGWNGSNF